MTRAASYYCGGRGGGGTDCQICEGAELSRAELSSGNPLGAAFKLALIGFSWFKGLHSHSDLTESNMSSCDITGAVDSRPPHSALLNPIQKTTPPPLPPQNQYWLHQYAAQTASPSLQLLGKSTRACTGVHFPKMLPCARFYTGVLGFRQLARPGFPFGGAWLQAGGLNLHLIERDPSVDMNDKYQAEGGSRNPEPWHIRRSEHKGEFFQTLA